VIPERSGKLAKQDTKMTTSRFVSDMPRSQGTLRGMGKVFAALTSIKEHPGRAKLTGQVNRLSGPRPSGRLFSPVNIILRRGNEVPHTKWSPA